MSGFPAVDLAQAVLDYWLGPYPDDGNAAVERREFWYRGGPTVDAEIKGQFGGAVQRAVAGEPSIMQWRATPAGSAALVILLDQFTRSMFRGSSQAWSGDARAMPIAQRAVREGLDKPLSIAARLFLYHPYHHSERVEEQDEGVCLFEQLGLEAGPSWETYLTRTLEVTRSHRDIVARFGRFPHRNAAMGRENTPEETEFLAENPEAYGQVVSDENG